MGFLRRSDNAKPDYTSLQLQTSVSILPVPIVWGQNRISPNVIWYANFQAIPSGSGKGIGGKGGLFGGGAGAAGADYTYTADIIMALCEGPLSAMGILGNGIGVIWKDLALYTESELYLGSYSGATPQPVWPYLAETYPNNALAYQGTAYLWGAGYNLGDSASIGNHNVEVYGPFAGTGANGIDADPALVINDFLTNAQYGAGFNPASIDSTTLFGSGGDASLQSYCKAMGLAFSPALVSQEQASSILARWLQILSCAAVWSGGLLKFIPYGDTAIEASSSTTYQTQFSVPAPVPESSQTFKPPSFVTVCAPQNFVSDGGVVYAFNNIPFVFIGAQAPTAAGTYGMISPGQYIFAALDYGQPIKITWTAAPSTSYVPNLTPAYALTDDNYVDEKGNKDPVQVERVDVFSLPTIQRVEVSARDNQYAAMPVEARDQSQIEIFGPRVGSTISAHEICDEHVIGPLVAQTILQRELYVRTKFTFKLSWEFCLLDPMDIVTLTDTNLGLSNYPVRVIQIEEDDKGLLAFTCEELVTGVSTPAFYQSASTAGSYQPNWGVPALPVNAPLIFEPPPGLTGGVAQVWFGASGINGGGGTQWGGANVYVSVDDVTYSQIAVLTAPLRQGFLTANLPAASGWDSVDTLAVTLAESGGTLAGTTQAAAQAGATLSLVDSEILAYEIATLTSANAYNLTGLARGIGGSVAAAHSSGAPFARLDGAVARYDIPANFIGQTIYFKFQSFNVFGGGTQELSACQAYTFVPTQASTVVTSTSGGSGGSGSGPSTPAVSPIMAQLQSGFPLNLGSVESAPSIGDNFGTAVGSPAPTASVNLGTVSVSLAHPIATQLLSGSPVNLGITTSYPAVTDNLGSVSDSATGTVNLGAV
jgi:Putative phage tail protein